MSNVTEEGDCHLEVAVAPPSCGSSPPTSLRMRPPSGRCEVCLLRPVSCWSPDGRHAVGRFLSTLWTSEVHSGVIHHYRRHTVSISSTATHAGLFGGFFCFRAGAASEMKMTHTNWEAPQSLGIFKGVQLWILGTWLVSAWITFKDHLCTLFWTKRDAHPQSVAPSLKWTISPLRIE